MKRILAAAVIVLAAAAILAGGADGAQPDGSSCTVDVGASQRPDGTGKRPSQGDGATRVAGSR